MAGRVRVGIIVDGDAEYRSLSRLFGRVPLGGQVVSVLRGDLQPLAPFGVMARAVRTSLNVLGADRVELAVVLLDREQRPDCPSEIAVELCRAIESVCAPLPVPRVHVVVKDRCFENWLVGDVETVVSMRKRFTLTDTARREIQIGRADGLDAQRLLKRSAIGKSYSKIADAIAIFERADPLKVARGSRSFRRLLRVIDHPQYKAQSKNPA